MIFGYTPCLCDLVDEDSRWILKYYLTRIKQLFSWPNDTIVDHINNFLSEAESLTKYSDAVRWDVVVNLFFNPRYLENSYYAGLKEIRNEQLPRLTCVRSFNEKLTINDNTIKNSIEEYYHNVVEVIDNNLLFNEEDIHIFANKEAFWECINDEIIVPIQTQVKNTENNIKNGIIDRIIVSYEQLFEPLSDVEAFLIRNRYIIPLNSYITKMRAEELCRNKYIKRVNDRESAIIGVDLMHQIKAPSITGEVCGTTWVETSSVTSKMGVFCKLNEYITKNYKQELEQARQQCFSGNNQFSLDKRCYSMIGYCVEYYSKYLLYGESYIEQHIKKALEELGNDSTIDNRGVSDRSDYIIIRACMFKYREMVARCFGSNATRRIQSISTEKLASNDYKEFVKLIITLGTRTARYVKKMLYPNTMPTNNIDPDLSIRHISGLADYITEDTILDVKVRNYIDENCVRQVLAYHYLSTKRSDLNIKRVIVYDATSDKAVTINMSHKCSIHKS